MRKFHILFLFLVPMVLWAQNSRSQKSDGAKKNVSEAVLQEERTIKSPVKAQDTKSKTQLEETGLQGSESLLPEPLYLRFPAGQEIISKRNENSKTFADASGTNTAVISAGPIHYKKNGRYMDIRLNVTSNPSAEFSLANTANILKSYFGSDAHKGLKNSTEEGELIEFLNTQMYWEAGGQKFGLRQSEAVTPLSLGNRVMYNGLYGRISVEFIIQPAKRKLNYIIPDRQSLGIIPQAADYLVFSEDILLPFGWNHRLTENGILITDSYGKNIYLYQNPNSTDSSVNQENGVNTVYKVTRIGNTLRIETRVSTDWLLSNQRQFPVKVDPTVTVYPDEYAYWMWSVDENGDEGPPRVTQNTFGKSVYNKQIQLHILFDTSSIPQGSTIDAAEGFFCIQSGYGSSPWTREWQWYNSASPLHTSGSQLYSSATTALSDPAGTVGPGVRSKQINSPLGTDYIKTTIDSHPPAGQNYVPLAIKPYGAYNSGEYLKVEDQYSPNHPYLIVTYNDPSCAAPSNPTVSSITETSAVFSWTAASPAPASGYQIHYNPYGTTPDSTSPVNGSTGPGVTTLTKTGLSKNTVHHFWVRSNCGGVQSEWVYGGYFNTGPSYSCYQGDGQIRGGVIGALNVNPATANRAADDFIVPSGKTFELRQITIEAISAASISSATIRIRSDQSGKPGAVIETYSQSPTSEIKYSEYSGKNVYHLTFNLPYPYHIYPAGTYWMDIELTNTAGTDVLWRVTTAGSNGAPAQLSTNGGTNWNQNTNGYQAMFYVSGVCNDAPVCEPVTAAADNSLVCSGEEVILSATSSGTGYTYSWYTDWDTETRSGTFLATGNSVGISPDKSQLYTVVATKTGCSSGDVFDQIAVAVKPALTELTVSPETLSGCSAESGKLSVTGGGTLSEYSLNERFNPDEAEILWVNRVHFYSGGDPNNADWEFRPSDPGFVASPDNTSFGIVGSMFAGTNEIESSLTSYPLSLLGHQAPVSLHFYHSLQTAAGGSGFTDAYIEISTDGGTVWNQIGHYNTKQGDDTSFKEESISLDAYAGQAFVQIRFRYHSKDDQYWAVDNVSLTGSPKEAVFSWLPYTGLYTDPGLTIPYTGQNISEVYASTAAGTTYTVSADIGSGCPVSKEIYVENTDRNWISTSDSSWDNPANWAEGSVPDQNSCVYVQSSATELILTAGTDAYAKTFTVQNGGSVRIGDNASLFVTRSVTNLSDASHFVIEDGGNLIQTDNDAVNTGDIRVEKQFILSAERKQYNFTISAVEGQQIKYIYPGNPTVIYHSENSNFFYNAYSGNYIAGRGLAVKEPSVAAVPDPNVTGVFTGKPFNGELNYTLSYTTDNPQSGDDHGYNLVGNPYPSALDAVRLYTDNWQKIHPSFLFWDNRGNTLYTQMGSDYNQSNYAVFNAAAGPDGTGVAAVGASGTLKKPNRYITVGSGFMIQAKPTANGQTLDFKNEYRTDGEGIDFGGKPGQFGGDSGRYWLTMTTPAGMETMTAVVYYEFGNDDFADDDTKRNHSSDEIYTLTGNEGAIIQTRSAFKIEDTVKMGYSAYENGTYIISLHSSEGVFEGEQDIYLIDKLTGRTANLSQKPYKFITRAGDYSDRFLIVYKPNKVGEYSAEDIIFANHVDITKRDGQIQISSSIDKITDIEVFDLNGNSVYKKADINSKAHHIDSFEFGKQILIVNVITETGEFVSKKFVYK